MTILRQKADMLSSRYPPRTIFKLLKKNLIAQDYVDYQFIQTSKIPTYHFQASLPRLPVPKLELTCERYLAAQRPLLITEAYRKTEDNVNHFRNTVGKQLQRMLKKWDNEHKHTSYISELWFDMYLRDRKPLPINCNPMLVFNDDERPEYHTQLIRTTNLLISSLRFFKSLQAGLLEPEVFHLNAVKSDTESFKNICSRLPPSVSWYGAYLYKAYPLDMSQYSNLFNTTRIPETDKDRIFSNFSGKHITVQYKGHIYAFKVLNKENDILPANQLLARLKFILNDDVAACEYPVGILTALERNKWATLRHDLQGLGNEATLKLIDSALFNISLDTEVVGNDNYAITRSFLHGSGENRWFDKSFSLLVSKDGKAAVNFEHSWGDGVAVLRYIQDIYKDSRTKSKVAPDTKPYDESIDSVLRLDFHLDDKLKNSITKAKENYKATCNSLDIDYLIFDGIGKNVCKQHGLSPDAVMQLGFQVAYFDMTGKFVPSYESCSTAAFKHGRTETVRPCTMATKNFTLAINSKTQPSRSELRSMIFECSKVHSQLTKEAAMGQGFDRHLFALRKFAEKEGIVSNVFDDPAYTTINNNIISTSTLGSPAIYAGAFGPVVQNGLGVAYMIRDDHLGVLVTTYPPHQSGSTFINALRGAYKKILSVLSK